MDIRKFFDSPKTKNSSKSIETPEHKAAKDKINKRRESNKKSHILVSSDDDSDFKISPTIVKKKQKTTRNTEGLENNKELENKKTKAIPKSTSAAKKHLVSDAKNVERIIIDERTQSENKEKRKYNFKEPPKPSALGSKEIPIGKKHCLLGSTFVLTGQLSSITREDTEDLIKRHGGRVTGAVSSRTSYVIVGDEPGNSKMQKAKSLGTKMLDEDQLFDLIKNSSPKGSPEQQIKQTTPKKQRLKSSETHKDESAKTVKEQEHNNAQIPHSDLWVDKYKPKTTKEICGNNSNIDKLFTWLKNFKSGDQAILMSGPPGIGKTTSAHLVCKESNYQAIELNASDTRNKSMINEILTKITTNSSMDNYFSNRKDTRKTAIILDEVDGMSSGDRGGIAEIISFIKKASIPIICICNDRQSSKIRTLANYCIDLRFSRPSAKQLNNRIKTILDEENLKLDYNVLEQLVKMSHADIRQIIMALSAWKIKSNYMSYENSTKISKEYDKNIILSPFDITRLYFSVTSYNQETINNRIEHYFTDFSLIPLMVYQNYIKCTPSSTSKISNNSTRELETLRLVAKSAESIMYGDIINKSIVNDQAWSLMPMHSVFSCVLPSFYMHGHLNSMIEFPSILGNISKSSKYNRLLNETYINISPHISSNRLEYRKYYIPYLGKKLAFSLIDKTEDEIDPALETMKHYKLDKETFDNILDFGVGNNSLTIINKSIPTKTKTAFTRLLNKSSAEYSSSKVSIKSKVKPEKQAVNLEDAPIESDSNNDDDVLSDDSNMSNDKNIIKSKNKKPAKKGPTTKRKSKANKK